MVAFFTYKVYQSHHRPTTMATHPEGIVVDIVGIEESSHGRSCSLHDVCGNRLSMDSVVRLRKVQIINDYGREETAVAAYWVTDGVDLCRVGFLPRQYIKQADKYDGKLAQITEFLSESESPYCRHLSHRNRGMCHAAIITGGPEFGEHTPTLKRIHRNLYCASVALSPVPMTENIDQIDGNKLDKKKKSVKRLSTANSSDVDAKKNAKLQKEK
jgi:hypothetical protein